MNDIILYFKQRIVFAKNEEQKQEFERLLKICEKCGKDSKNLNSIKDILTNLLTND